MKRRRRPQYRQARKLPKGGLKIVTGFWWILLMALIFLVEPTRLQNVAVSGLYLPFILLLFLAVSGTMYLLRRRFWPSVIWAIGVSLFLILRVYGWGNVINFAMIALSLLALEIYWRKNGPETERQPVETITTELPLTSDN